jgi:hypothetical protein
MSDSSVVIFVEPERYFRVDFSGTIDADSLATRRAALIDSLRFHLAPGQTIRLLFDTRTARFDSPGAHRRMRELFGAPPSEFGGHDAFAAILSPHRDGSPSPHEAFFTAEAEALAWLASVDPDPRS